MVMKADQVRLIADALVRAASGACPSSVVRVIVEPIASDSSDRRYTVMLFGVPIDMVDHLDNLLDRTYWEMAGSEFPPVYVDVSMEPLVSAFADSSPGAAGIFKSVSDPTGSVFPLAEVEQIVNTVLSDNGELCEVFFDPGRDRVRIDGYMSRDFPTLLPGSSFALEDGRIRRRVRPNGDASIYIERASSSIPDFASRVRFSEPGSKGASADLQFVKGNGPASRVVGWLNAPLPKTAYLRENEISRPA